MLDQRRRRWADVVQMLFKGFVFAGDDTFCPLLFVSVMRKVGNVTLRPFVCKRSTLYVAVFHLAISNMAQRHCAFCERHVALQVRHVALRIFRQ